MSSSSLSGSSSSTELDPDMTPFTHPLWKKPKKTDEPKDWVKIGAIVAAVVGGVIALFAGACIYGIFPKELLGGPLGAGVTCLAGALILAPAALILVRKYLIDT